MAKKTKLSLQQKIELIMKKEFPKKNSQPKLKSVLVELLTNGKVKRQSVNITHRLFDILKKYKIELDIRPLTKFIWIKQKDLFLEFDTVEVERYGHKEKTKYDEDWEEYKKEHNITDDNELTGDLEDDE